MSNELLALAAKAAGYVVRQSNIVAGMVDDDGEMWNPLEDDADALRLAVRVGMSCAFLPQVWRESFCAVAADFSDGTPAVNVMEYHGEDAHAATRRAIVLAAAEVGRRMEDRQ